MRAAPAVHWAQVNTLRLRLLKLGVWIESSVRASYYTCR